MFKTHPDSMRMESTPERVFAVARAVAYRSMTPVELSEAMSLGKPGEPVRNEIRLSIAVANEELALISLKDGQYVLSAPKEAVASPDAFRRFVSVKAFANPDSTFVRFTRWYVAQNEGILNQDSWEVKAATAARDVPELDGLSENDALGWRFWAAFLGLGYLDASTLLPNMATKLRDILSADFAGTFSYGEAVSVTEFRPWLASRLPEADFSDVSAPWPLAVSAGLRTLRDLGLIQLEARRDTDRVPLYPDGDPLTDFSHITVREEVER